MSFEEFYKELSKTWQPRSCKNFRSMHLKTWQASEAYWSKRVEEMEKALDFMIICEATISVNDHSGIVHFNGFRRKGMGKTPLEAIQNAMKSNL